MSVRTNLIEAEAAVLGAGPAGSAAAYNLAKAGADVIVLEKQRFPRYKTCGGGVISKALNSIPYGIENIADAFCSKAEVLDHYSKLKFKISRDSPIIIMTMRDQFDAWLLNSAVQAGAKVYEGEEAVRMSEQSEWVELHTASKIYRAKYLIAADGASGISSKYFLKKKIKKIPALEAEIFTDNENFERFNSTARFDFGIIRFGYGWVFPKRDHLSVGILTTRPASENLNLSLQSYIDYLGVKNIIKISKQGYFIPVCSRESEFAKKRILLTGDAAGFADPITGEGISYAIQSGELAARAIMEGNFIPDEVVRIYSSLIQKNIISELRHAKLIASLFYFNAFSQKILFKLYGQKLCELMTDVITGRKTYGEILRNPINYVKLLRPVSFNRINNSIFAVDDTAA